MQKIILAYNFTPERLQMLRLTCMMLRVQLRAVARGELLQPVGYLAGVQGIGPVQEEYAGEEAAAEMLVLCGCTRPDLDRLLSAIKKGKLKQVTLKAMLTPYNAGWSGLRLQQELEREHEYMHSKKAPRPKHLYPATEA